MGGWNLFLDQRRISQSYHTSSDADPKTYQVHGWNIILTTDFHLIPSLYCIKFHLQFPHTSSQTGDQTWKQIYVYFLTVDYIKNVMASFKFRTGIPIPCKSTGNTTGSFTASSVVGGYINRLMPVNTQAAKGFHCRVCSIRRSFRKPFYVAKWNFKAPPHQTLLSERQRILQQ
jgi:hypothetical protein